MRYQKLFDYTISPKKPFDKSLSSGVSEENVQSLPGQMYLWKLCLIIIGLVGALYFATPAMAGDETNVSPATLSQERELFQVEMFDGEHLGIPNKTIAAKIDYYNDSDLLGGITLENVVVTVLVPKSSYFNSVESSGDWTCDNDGAEGDVCRLAIGTVQAGQSGSLRFAATMYASSSIPEAHGEITTMGTSLHADNMPTSAVELFRNDVMLGMSAPTSLALADEPAIHEPLVQGTADESSADFQVFLPVVMRWQ